ncbi:hypothetical protein GobsT_01830 [Gemmata obscuriglobus]|uniref:Uncharacterized protein n=1 Tax=Gemmata obscuriglobus TaxID=114 RepID=A0A2Z3H8J1_9BACT|nr:hypothetical protein C1280_32230 [Gemmata obscuriglobus]QEG25457.1 hypothetical protein GobsT_01830 [Gemmata obscuriglobus]VTR98636.1 hypothetical protein : [Gemmata obscuriglobus UQM 2246]
MQSVAYGPDGTLFALTGGELWAYPAGGTGRVLVARETAEDRFDGWLDVSPDGHWLAVTGFEAPTLFKVGSFAPPDAPNAESRCLLRGWNKYRFPDRVFYSRMCFTGDSTFWFGRTERRVTRYDFRYWRLPNLTEFEYSGFSDTDCQHVTTVPGTSQIVIDCWSRERGGVAYWSGDLAQPEARVTKPVGTTEHCNGFLVGSDGRYYVSDHQRVLIYSVGRNGFHLDLTVELPHCESTPKLSLCADARRFIAHCFESKLVCAIESGTGQMRGPWDWGVGKVNDAAIAPDGLAATVGGSSKKLAVWDLDD